MIYQSTQNRMKCTVREIPGDRLKLLQIVQFQTNIYDDTVTASGLLRIQTYAHESAY